jgi:Spy/CpxP family protein refolding chaperone
MRFFGPVLVLGLLAVSHAGPVTARGSADDQQPSSQRASQTPSGQATPSQPATGSQRAAGQSGRRYGPVPGPIPTGPDRDFSPWWKDTTIVKEIALTADQAGRINRLYEKRRSQIQLHVDELEKQTAELNKMLTERIVTPDVVELQAQRLMAPRMIIDTSRIKMLYEMSRVLTPDQNRKLREFFDRMRNQDRGRGHGPS